jgi:hypothetical protein
VPETPYLAPLLAVVEAIYARSPSHVPATLEVCSCPVCMSADTLASIIATPVRDLTADHLSEYRNSAHGVPLNPDDLRTILPRYLDLMARDEWCDHLGVGANLVRFGDGRVTHAPLFDPETEELLNQWARLMILHSGAAEAMEDDTDYGTLNLTEVLLVGGWPTEVVISALDELFASAHGPPAQKLFFSILGNALHRYGAFQMWGLDRYRAEAIPAFATWLNDFLCRSDVLAWLCAPQIFAQPWADPLVTISGNITRQTFAVKN